MPTVLQFGLYSFIFFSSDRGEPAHFAQKIGEVIYKIVYAHWRWEKPKWEELFDDLSFDCSNVPSSKAKRNNADRRLIDYCRRQILPDTSTKTVILVSGDGDFKQLVRELKASGKKVIVVVQYLNKANRKLVQLADEFYSLSQLC